MSLAHDLARALIRGRRSHAPISRAELDIDAGALMTPTSYPYPPGMRAIRPFGARVAIQGGGPRPAGQLYPPTGNPTQRRSAHVDYQGRATAARAGTADAAGIRRQAKIVRVRPWLFAGGSSARPSDRAAATPPAALGGPCEGCG